MPVRNNRLYIAAPVSGIQLVYTSINKGPEIPCMDVSFPMDCLLSVTVLLNHMTQTAQVPTVHVWKGEADRTEIAVIFNARNPTSDVKRKMMPYAGGLTLYDQMITTGEADIDSGAAETFFDAVAAANRLLLIVTEECSDNKDVIPLAEFEIPAIEHYQPLSLG